MEALNKIFLILFFTFLSCNRKEGEVELIILNENLITYNNDYVFTKDTINIVKYKVFNNTNSDFFFYLTDDNISAIYIDNYTKLIRVFENKTNKEVEYKDIMVNTAYDTCSICKREESQVIRNNKKLVKMPKEYFKPFKNEYFFLKRGETKYFESIVKIQANAPVLDDINVTYAVIDKNKSYYMKMYINTFKINSDFLPWSLKQTIEKNNYYFYDKQIVSKNKVPIKILDK